jgi:uncharacterized DUF497 family protein
MEERQFEWDENKNLSNIDKHGLDFNYIKEIFDDIKRKTSPDLRSDFGEDRWITIGKVGNTVLVVVFTLRDSAYRLISARYAKEKNIYLNK